MTLSARIALTRGTFSLDVEFTVPEGTVLALLGPNGSGKSTVLGSLAGLVPVTSADITLAGRTLAGERVDLAPHERGIGLLSQDALLFPHLSALDNVGFAPRAAGASRAKSREVAQTWLAEVDASAFARRRPGQLSGGQQQRVAIARALASAPSLLLLDEPFAALDVDAAPAIRGLLRRVLRGGPTTVLVTHDPLDALALADHVAVMSGGRIVERGPTRDVLAAPRTAFTARIAGLNLVAGVAEADGLRTKSGDLVSGLLSEDAVVGEAAVAVFEPSAVAVYPHDGEHRGSPRNTVEATVAALEPHGPVIRLRVTDGGWGDGLSADLTPAAVADLELEPGSPVTLSVKAATVAVHPAQS
ncbi:sulfate/molybdate ABC transporter ATP-binding protein [Amycolatopsis sp. FDAARGOS 1241]|uniref:sulfate/molybdate ABC transporter ATP-binding protein n=1 Tax=Amycolatopsis sp. FDAARGOS 1241 TaxID=2778070 RepID=UPI0019526678|nr:ABC transporter ATP-binding protein [Amycolatopsis sp. FDAARGOS 1241]QRP46765.1 ABC transporter ATP-binding protein [Amycolatopsis sp. FDAARGOS 1241]